MTVALDEAGALVEYRPDGTSVVLKAPPEAAHRHPRVSRLDLVVGPNGAGKSTLVRLVIQPSWPAAVFVNADEIARRRWGADAEAHAYDAAAIAAATRSRLIAHGRPLIAETVFSHPSKLDLVDEALAAGYYVALHAVLVPSSWPSGGWPTGCGAVATASRGEGAPALPAPVGTGGDRRGAGLLGCLLGQRRTRRPRPGGAVHRRPTGRPATVARLDAARAHPPLAGLRPGHEAVP